MTLSPRERRLLMLLGLVAGAGLLRLVWLAATPPPSVGAAAQTRVRTGRGARATAARLPDAVVEIRTDRLEVAPREFAVGRDLFRYGAPPPPPPPSAEELERRRRESEERRRLAEATAAEASVPRPPPVTVRYLGSFGPSHRRVAVFVSSDGENVLNAAEGEAIERRFIVVEIGLESVDLGFVGFPQAPAHRLGLNE